LVNGSIARDGRTTMRIVFANGVERILGMPSGPSGKIPDSTVLAIRMFEATALYWTRSDQEYLDEMAWIEKQGFKGDEATLARWTATLAALGRAEMLDRSTVPVEDYGGSSEEAAAGAGEVDAA